MPVVSMSYLLEAGVHFGHQTRRWNPKMKEYIFTSRDGIYIIDLSKTANKIEEAYEAFRKIAEDGGKFLFVGTKKQAQDAVREEAERADMYYVNERWLGGTLTNFKTIRKRVNRMEQLEKMELDGTFDRLPKKEVILLKKEHERLVRYLEGIRYMDKVPQALFIVDPKKEEIAIREARKLGIPVFGIVDTNCDPDMVDYVIPGNDDAIRAVKLIVGVLVNAIIEVNGGQFIDYLTEDDKNPNKKGSRPPRKERGERPERKELPRTEIAPKKKEPANLEKPKAKEVPKPKEEPKEDKKPEAKPEPKVETPAKKESKTEKQDLSKLTVAELKVLAKEKGITGISTMKKADLIDALK